MLALALAFQLQIPTPTGYVNDFAGVIDDRSRQAMLAVIDEVRQKSGGEIVVVTLQDLGDRPSIDVARDIGRQWKVGARGGPGDRARNAGVVLLLKPGTRPGDGQAEIAIATGRGSEGFVTDAAAGRIRDAIGRAAVEAGRYDAGLGLGVRLLGEAYAREFGFDLSGPAPPPAPEQRPLGNVFWTTAWILILLWIILAKILAGFRHRRYGLGQAILWGLFYGGHGRSGRAWSSSRGGSFGGFGGGGGFSGGGASGRF